MAINKITATEASTVVVGMGFDLMSLANPFAALPTLVSLWDKEAAAFVKPDEAKASRSVLDAKAEASIRRNKKTQEASAAFLATVEQALDVLMDETPMAAVIAVDTFAGFLQRLTNEAEFGIANVAASMLAKNAGAKDDAKKTTNEVARRFDALDLVIGSLINNARIMPAAMFGAVVASETELDENGEPKMVPAPGSAWDHMVREAEAAWKAREALSDDAKKATVEPPLYYSDGKERQEWKVRARRPQGVGESTTSSPSGRPTLDSKALWKIDGEDIPKGTTPREIIARYLGNTPPSLKEFHALWSAASKESKKSLPVTFKHDGIVIHGYRDAAEKANVETDDNAESDES